MLLVRFSEFLRGGAVMGIGINQDDVTGRITGDGSLEVPEEWCNGTVENLTLPTLFPDRTCPLLLTALIAKRPDEFAPQERLVNRPESCSIPYCTSYSDFILSTVTTYRRPLAFPLTQSQLLKLRPLPSTLALESQKPGNYRFPNFNNFPTSVNFKRGRYFPPCGLLECSRHGIF